jgi:hypothetical protein
MYFVCKKDEHVLPELLSHDANCCGVLDAYAVTSMDLLTANDYTQLLVLLRPKMEYVMHFLDCYLWVVTPSNLVDGYRHFLGTCCHHLLAACFSETSVPNKSTR